MSIKENLSKIKEQIADDKVKIIAVTKYASDEETYEAYKLGIQDFGESYAQDALERISRKIADENFQNKVNWHFVGRLQKNKAKYVVGSFSLIHSVDSFELANLINRLAFEKNIVQDILLQVNISGEISKAGFKEDDLNQVFDQLKDLTNIKILGLMTMAPNTEDEKLIENSFKKLKVLRDSLNEKYSILLSELSMGMSNDYRIAVKCGATMVRLGRAIFKDFLLRTNLEVK